MKTFKSKTIKATISVFSDICITDGDAEFDPSIVISNKRTARALGKWLLKVTEPPAPKPDPEPRVGFSERKSKSDTTPPEKLLVLAEAKAIADEWVTPMRLKHVTDTLRAQLQRDLSNQDIPAIVSAMVEDVFREGAGEIVESKEARRAIGTKAVQMLKSRA